MDTRFKLNMFVTSFLPLWLSIIIMDTWDVANFVIEECSKDNGVETNLLNIICLKWLNITLVCSLIILCICAMVWLSKFIKGKQNNFASSEGIKIMKARKERLL